MEGKGKFEVQGPRSPDNVGHLGPFWASRGPLEVPRGVSGAYLGTSKGLQGPLGRDKEEDCSLLFQKFSSLSSFVVFGVWRPLSGPSQVESHPAR